MSVQAIIKKILSSLRLHKKKSAVLFIIIAVIAAYRYMKSQKQLDKILHKMQEKITTQIVKNLKETETVRRLMLNMEDLYSHFASLRPGIKRNLKREIENMFILTKIKEDLKQKGLTAEQKRILWSDLKLEIFTHTAFTLTVVSIANLISYLRDCVVQKYEKDLQNNEEAINTLNDMLNDFTDFLIKNGTIRLYSYYKSQLEPILGGVAVTAQYDMEKIDDLLGSILEVVLKKQTVTHSSYEAKGGLNGRCNPTIKDVNGISKAFEERRKSESSPTLLSKKFYRLEVPNVRTIAITHFMEPIAKFSLTTDEKFIRSYCDHSKGETEAVSDNGEKFNNMALEPNRVEALQKVDTIIQVTLVSNVLKKATDELLDLLESKNFDLILSFSIRYEFIKLKNRLLLYFEKNKCTDKMNLANYIAKINQVVNDEFLDESSDLSNQEFYNRRLKLALAQSSEKNEANTSNEQSTLR